MKKRIIVTGGAGFVASHLVDAYLKAGHSVAVIDNLSSGFRRNLNPKARFYKNDILDRAAMDRIFKKERPELVSHYAAVVEVVKSLRDPIPSLDANLIGTANVLLAFANHGRGKEKRRFIFASSCASYGTPKHIPVKETDPKVPESAYGLSKLLDESIIEFFARHYGFTYVIFRYPNIYGPRQNPKGEAGVTAIFGDLMKNGKQPIIFGDGTKGRDYIYVDDVVRANMAGFVKGDNVIMNLGTGKVTTDQMIFDSIAAATGYKGKPVYAPYRRGEAYRISMDTKLVRRILGWKPTMPFKKGIAKTIEALP
ncbi:MAG TPA: NAD-dependent epimerase/dehydratase family protein [Candidatus Paceibacterota bacterium]|nr:NAD-dependent epimerase/dehydratase family protein [Candidatus Paceibacterota bacterium]